MSLIFNYLRLCWFKGDPNDLNPSASFLWGCIAFYLVSGIIIEANISDPADATLEVGMRAIMALSLLSALAFFTRHWFLFRPLLAAVFMCENIIITLGIGVEIIDDQLQNTEYEDYPIVLGVVLLLWYLLIIAYIFRRMFTFHRNDSIGLAIGYFLMTYGLPFMLMEAM